MIITQPLDYELPRVTLRVLRRSAVTAKRRATKLINSKTKRAARSLSAAARRQYYLTSAVADVHTAARRNEDIVLSSLMSLGVITSCCSFCKPPMTWPTPPA
jgi:hypothetical protein